MGVLRYQLPPQKRLQQAFTIGDVIVLLLIASLLYGGIRLALNAPESIVGPQISLSTSALPWYALLSLGRMFAAYLLSLLFTLTYGRAAAYNRRAEMILMPLLDVLQSVPILSFLPIVLLSLSAFLPQRMAAELASIVLIFTSQAWNMTFGWYQSLTTIPNELREASAIFRLNAWLRFKRLELPFGMISLIWNSIMSFAGGWFFLMAAEIFTVGNRDFRLAGLGAYLQEAANQGDTQAILWGLFTLIITIVALDQLLWRPLLAWSDRFKLEMVESDNPPTSWVYDLMHKSRLYGWTQQNVITPLTERVDLWMLRMSPSPVTSLGSQSRFSAGLMTFYALLLLTIGYGGYRAFLMLGSLSLTQWLEIGLGVGVTFLRVATSLLIALCWTIPLGVAVGTKPDLARFIQPLIQIAASIPATAIFPILLMFLIHLSGGLNIAAILLMLMGTQWYLLFNIIAGASAIPQDLKYTTSLLQLSAKERWRTLILPALFPYLITGAITASGGAWNASIVAEYVHFGGQTISAIGIGALISHATAVGDYPLLLAATLSMILTVVLVNRLIWRRFYRVAEEKYRME
ncbi:MAG: ABC transporter permease subunit [Anaerolineales bacterium]|nr:ABC transporter permease subunit [Anaerolineales bacterium]